MSNKINFDETDQIPLWDDYNNQLRQKHFEGGYKHKHPVLFDYMYFDDKEKEEFFKQYIHPDIHWAETQKYTRWGQEWDFLLTEPAWEVYQFPFFTKELSNMIIEEAEHFDEWVGPDEGPNNSISYGTTDTGLDGIPGTRNYKDKPLGKLYYDIQHKYLKPIMRYVWKYRVSHFEASYILKYELDGQDFLQPHHDDNLCSSIVSLNDNFEGGGTLFERQKVTVYPKAGWCTIHPGKLTHRHAGKRVTKGKRYILITFID